MPSSESGALPPAYLKGRARLGDLTAGHDNNLNLLRVLAATMVLISHSFVLVSGDRSAEPWLRQLGTTPGGLAVDVFFAVSGFLVTGSLERSGSLARFVAARALRIYPALWVSLLLTAIAVGIWFTDLSFTEFMRSPQTWRWLGKNALMVTAEGPLPAAFLHVPGAGVVNGSLWTLRWELRCYLLVALLWCLLRWLNRRRSVVSFAQVIVMVAIGLSAANLALQSTGHAIDYVELAAMFFQGAALWVLRARVVIGWRAFLALSSALLIGSAVSPQAFQWAHGLCLAWFTLQLAYLPHGIIRRYNRLGDYSYGIYIFAFPIQQAILSIRPGLGAWELIIASGLCTSLFAVLSWHVVEERALTLKDRLSRRLHIP
jgi:peptidoglycan/LPS O-acetylase OafA/YrhL